MDYRKKLIVGLVFIMGFSSAMCQTSRGKASYYSKKATGARTASGERLHHDSLTCAHKTYPFGTLLKVRNLSNNREIIVRVTDRGPFIRGRIIDLSYGAARELGMLLQGIAMVEVEKVDAIRPPYRVAEAERGLSAIDFNMEDLVNGEIKEVDRMPDNNLQDTKEKVSKTATTPKTIGKPIKTTVGTDKNKHNPINSGTKTNSLSTGAKTNSGKQGHRHDASANKVEGHKP